MRHKGTHTCDGSCLKTPDNNLKCVNCWHCMKPVNTKYKNFCSKICALKYFKPHANHSPLESPKDSFSSKDTPEVDVKLYPHASGTHDKEECVKVCKSGVECGMGESCEPCKRRLKRWFKEWEKKKGSDNQNHAKGCGKLEFEKRKYHRCIEGDLCSECKKKDFALV